MNYVAPVLFGYQSPRRTGASRRDSGLVLFGYRNRSLVHEFWYRQHWTSSGPNHASCRRAEDPPADGTAGSDTDENQVCVDISRNARDFCGRVAAHDACMNFP